VNIWKDHDKEMNNHLLPQLSEHMKRPWHMTSEIQVFVYLYLWNFYIFFHQYTVKPVLRGHILDKEKVVF
jgi:hypothetical protein